MMRTRLSVWLVVVVVGLVRAQAEERQGKQLNDQEQKYDFQLSFPIDSDEATNVLDGRKSRIDNLLNTILLETQKLAVNDTLPGTQLDPASISFTQSFRCTSGEVVVDDQCVPCPPGTFFNGELSVCTKCPVGQFNPEFAQKECIPCPTYSGIDGVTEGLGAVSDEECKRKCEAGNYYDKVTDLCRPCGYGSYQSEAGKFVCDLCPLDKTTRDKNAVSADECLPNCESGNQLGSDGECAKCSVGTYRTKGIQRVCQECPEGKTTRSDGSFSEEDCNLPICKSGQYLNATVNSCTPCPRGSYQPKSQQTSCIDCPAPTSTVDLGATSRSQCTNPCLVEDGEKEHCDKNAFCQVQPPSSHTCTCKPGYNGTGTGEGSCFDLCDGFCINDGQCLKNREGKPYCTCVGSFTGPNCKEKSEFAYIAGGIAGAVLFVILLVLLIWMICVRSNKSKRVNEKFLQQAGEMAGSQVNFYYGAPAPYAESIAPSQHGSTYAHYYEDEEDGWGMPNFYDTYGKNSKMARSNGSLYNAGAGMYGPQYAPQGELYDRLGRHAYQPRPEDKSGNDTTSESDDDRSRRQ